MTASLPLSFVPELADRYGLPEAVMLAVLTELVGAWQGSVTVDEQRLYNRAGGLSRQQQGELLAKLSSLDLVTITPATAGMLSIHLQLEPQLTRATVQASNKPALRASQTSQIRQSKPVHPSTSNSVAAKPKNLRGRDDELSRIFDEKEAQQAMQGVMFAQWQPSVNILRMLTQNMQVSEAFAMGLRDEFVVYYMDKERRESPGGWDQKFLKWVKKEHVQQQTATARAQQQNQTRSYAHNEEARYHAREQRQQLTDAVLDLGNTDW
jgi:hypothetical protein